MMKTEMIMVVNDWPGLGKAAASINVPILNAAQYEVALLPTLLLSTHTGFEGFVIKSLGDSFMEFAKHWQTQPVQYPAILTGYFENAAQIEQFVTYLEIIRLDQAQDAIVVTDPIMAEGGQLYPGFTEDIITGMRHLLSQSDIILPNITEAYLLADLPYQPRPTHDELCQLTEKLHQLGPDNVIVTGVHHNEQIGFFLSQKDHEPVYIMHQYYETEYCGTGDTAISLLTVFHLAGDSLQDSLKKSSILLEEAMHASYQQGRSRNMGINFEKILPKIATMMTKNI